MIKKSPTFFTLTALLAVITGLSGTAGADSIHVGTSLQGFTGLLNTPNASVLPEGHFEGLYTNQEESAWRKKVRYQDNFIFNAGLFDFVEVGGRLLHAPGVTGGGGDLSANVKVTSAPITRRYSFVPDLAFGMQDLGGGAKFLQTKYVVASEELWRLRLSVGYGTGPDRMDGIFGGAEFKAHDWLYLLGEYDTTETNIGARIVTPHIWNIPVSFTATAKTSLDHKLGNFDFAFGFVFPLDFTIGSKKAQAATARGTVQDASPTKADAPRAGSPEVGRVPDAPPAASVQPRPAGSLADLRDRLIAAGFLNVRVGEGSARTLVLEFENTIFNHNELDAIGVVAGLAVEGAGDRFETVRLVVKKKDLRVMQIAAPVATFREVLGQDADFAGLRRSISVTAAVEDDAAVSFVEGDGNSSFLTTTLALWPGLTTFVGTEYGAFDYLLSLKPEVFVNLWKGAMFNARWDIPVSWSGNLDDGQVYRNSRASARVERVMLFQGINVLPGLLANLGGGLLRPDLYGTMNEVVWQPGDGKHRVRLGMLWGRNDETETTNESYLASYRFYFSPLDLSLEGTAGKFFYKDTGGMVELRRFFGDTAFSVYYKNTTTVDKKDWQAVGVQVAFPLTFGKDMKHYYNMQVRGTDEWSYAQESTLKNRNNDDGRGALNYLPSVPLASVPLFTGSIHSQYQNRDRLSEAYVLPHLHRLREAWDAYRGKL